MSKKRILFLVFMLAMNDGESDTVIKPVVQQHNLGGGFEQLFAAGDLDGNGITDFVGVNHQNGKAAIERFQLIIWLNVNELNGFSKTFASSWIVSEVYPSDLQLIDVNGDQALDVVVARNGQPVLIFFNDQTAHPFDRANSDVSFTEPYASSSVSGGDLDGDGDQDIVIGNKGEPNRYFLNDGFGRFSNVDSGHTLGDGNLNTFKILLGDLDNDGDLDAVEANFHAQNYLYLNQGGSEPFDGVVPTVIGIGAIQSHFIDTHDVILGDINNDGFLDVLVFSGNSKQYKRELYINNQSFHPFQGVEPLEIRFAFPHLSSISLSDYDQDGDLDLIAYGGVDLELQQSLFEIKSNTGAIDIFGESIQFGISSRFPQHTSIFLANVTGDSKLDLVTSKGVVAEHSTMSILSKLPFDKVNLLTPSNQDGVFEFLFSGPIGEAMQIEGSNDLQNWSRIESLINEAGSYSLRIPSSEISEPSFFRIIHPQ